ncbi:hypothetical protein CXB51_010354 [Gossypium anomalum]|uniref:DUF7745 domain-containing protein n=1 Tax=Gossypium anomalum TaxID=47600 RepID=A0A8J5Z795_9ROSI|nr:hypothetical protein CXB51_010354 [Gossypium anomalum]
MEELIIQTTEKNAVVRDWSLKTQKEKGDSLMEGCVSNLPEHVTVNWDSDTRGIFTERYEDIANLIAINVDEQAMVRFWDPAYRCFTFNQEDMTPTIEEYTALLCIDNITKKNETSCIPWFSLRELVLNHPDMLRRVKKGINPVPTILAETFRSLSICRRKEEGRFIGCAQLLNVWILSHFWKVERTPFHMFSKTFSSLEAYLEKEWPKEVTEQHWVSVFQNLRAKDVTWRAPWIRPSAIFFTTIIPVTGGLSQSEFAFTGKGYMRRVRDTAKSWKKIHLMELALYADTLTQDYDLWRKQQVNSQ